MSAPDTDLQDVARLWAIRVGDPAFTDWDGLTEWLEQGTAHLDAYEAAQRDADWGAALLTTEPLMESRVETAPRRWWLAAGGAIAASLALVFGWANIERGGAMQQIATAPGEQRTIDLADGSRVALNGATRVSYDPAKPRYMVLEQGEALFEVRHDEANPFVVVSGETRLVDAGTVFNVVREGEELQVAVSEGAVIYKPGPGEVRLNPGDTLEAAGPGTPRLGKTSTEAVGGWQTGAIYYDKPTRGQVARDLSRNIGRPVRTDEPNQRMSFTGIIMVRGSPEQVLARAGPLLGVTFAANGEGWTMSPADGSKR